jgi:hypothetical protein
MHEGKRVLVSLADLQAGIFKLARQAETMAGELKLGRPLTGRHEAMKDGNCE